jgi:cell shape-determining protein MreD
MGVVWSGVLLLPAAIVVAARILRGLRDGGAPLPVRLHVACAYLNLLLAALLGLHLGLRKDAAAAVPLPHVYAHVHLAAAGWATLMVMGVGYRLLAMLLPAKPPSGVPTWLTLILFEAGLLGLVGALMARSAHTGPYALVLAAGLLLFLGLVLRMRRNLVPAPPKLKRPDWGVLHVAQALLYLGVATGVGLSLAFGAETDVTGIGIYGVVGLLGFLAQMIVGVEMRLLPMFAFTESFARSGHKTVPASPHDMPWRPLQVVSLAAWTAGVPLLAWGLGAEVGDLAGEGAVRAGAWALLAGTVAAGASTARVLVHAYRRW